MVGEFDVATVAALSGWFSAAIAVDSSDLVVDVSGVSFMDAATISVLIRAAGLLREHSRSLLLRSPSRCARRILDVCELNSLIEREVGAPVEAAVGALELWVAVPATGPELAVARTPATVQVASPQPSAERMSDRPALVGAVPAGAGSTCERT